MKVILVVASSADGKITRGAESDVSKWTSQEDKDFFYGLIKKNNLIVMGAGTYEAVKKNLVHTPERLRVVMTRQPEKYRNDFIKDQLEFSDLFPTQLMDSLSKRGFEQMLLVSGGIINGLFLKENLVDEIYLTVEPKIFGSGKSLVDFNELNINLELQNIKKLNRKGTLLVHYLVDH